MKLRRPFLILWSVLVAKFFLSGVVCSEAGPRIDSGPSPVNVSVNGDAVFSCNTSHTSLVEWFVKASPVDNIPGLVDKQKRIDINATSEEFYIDIPVHSDLTSLLNNTLVWCVGFEPFRNGSYDTTNSSSPALLLIQGLVDVPTDVKQALANDSVNLTWTRPFIIKGIVFHYLINSTAFNASTTLYVNSTTTIEEIYSTATIDNSNCTVYEMCVQAVTAAGLGEAVCVNTSRIGAPRILKADDYNATMQYWSEQITVAYQFERDTCYGNRATTFNLDVVHRDGIISYKNRPVESYLHSEGVVRIEVSIPKYNQGFYISAVITLKNIAGSTPSQAKQTYMQYIQDISTSYNGSHTFVSCKYWPYSDPQGCKIVYYCTGHTSEQYFQTVFILDNDPDNFSNSSEVKLFNCSALSCSRYNIYAYGFESDNVVHENPSVVKMNVNICMVLPGSITLSPSVSLKPSLTPSSTQSDQKIPLEMILIVLLVFVSIAMLSTIIVCPVVNILWCKRKKKNKDYQKVDKSEEESQMSEP